MCGKRSKIPVYQHREGELSNNDPVPGDESTQKRFLRMDEEKAGYRGDDPDIACTRDLQEKPQNLWIASDDESATFVGYSDRKIPGPDADEKGRC